MKWRVLVVDDQRDTADALSALLEMMGHDVRYCQDGWAALDLDAKFRPHLILLDLGMPEMDGYETSRRMRALRRNNSSSPLARSPLSEGLIVALTGYAGHEDRQRSQACGFFRHLLKPVAPETLRRLFDDIDALIG